jgi:ribosomal-protein-alanine N-acetyltransferase
VSGNPLRIAAGELALRPWVAADVEALTRLGDDRDIWRNLHDPFPHPFTPPSAEMWLADRLTEPPTQRSSAILRRGEVVGGIRLRQNAGAHSICADLTFWVGRAFRGKGIATGAVRLATTFALETLLLERVQAFVFDWNPGSGRVLEKAGFTLEGRLRHYVLKDGRLGDALLYARLQNVRASDAAALAADPRNQKRITGAPRSSRDR